MTISCRLSTLFAILAISVTILLSVATLAALLIILPPDLAALTTSLIVLALKVNDFLADLPRYPQL